jgi:hypothetical protein
MSTSLAGGPRLPVVFDERSWGQDVSRIGAHGRALAQATRGRLEREGVALAELHRCQPEGPGGTALPGCVKFYLDHWRLVFRAATTANGEPALLCFALGLGHPPERSRIPSVYESLTGGCTRHPLPDSPSLALARRRAGPQVGRTRRARGLRRSRPQPWCVTVTSHP